MILKLPKMTSKNVIKDLVGRCRLQLVVNRTICIFAIHTKKMAKRTRIKDLLVSSDFGKQVYVMGWVRTFRNNQFIALNDGSTINNIQAVVDFNSFEESLLKRITTGAAISINGGLVGTIEISL